jgi:hypothetical protein
MNFSCRAISILSVMTLFWLAPAGSLGASAETASLVVQDVTQARHQTWLAIVRDCTSSGNGLPVEEAALHSLAWPPRSLLGVEVIEVHWDAVQAALRFRLRCQPRSSCLPYFVYGRPTSPLPEGQQLRTVCARGTAVFGHPNPAQAQTGFAVAGGTAVRLVTRTKGMRITQPAFCLDRGAVGEIVRVRLKSNGQILRAVVLDRTLTESLPE